MKIILLLLSLLYAVATTAQVQPVRLQVYPKNCMTDMESARWVYVQLYRQQDDSLMATLGLNETTGESTQSVMLPPGRYRAVSFNYMRQPRTQLIVPGDRDTAIGFCIDSLLAYPRNTLAKFKNRDSLVLDCYSTGCELSSASRIVIIRSGSTFGAGLYKADNAPSAKLHYNLVSTVTMDAAGMAAFMRFENELNVIDTLSWDCTTRDVYTIRSPYLNLRMQDATCLWGGFEHLRHSLFKLPEEE